MASFETIERRRVRRSAFVGVVAVAVIAAAVLVVGREYLGLDNLLGASTAGGQKATVAPQVAAPITTDGRIMVDASVVPAQMAALSFATSGIIAEVPIAEGNRVEAGQVIARLDVARQRAAVAQAEATVMQADAKLSELKAGVRTQEIETAKANLDAANAKLELINSGGRAEDIESARAALASARARYAKLQSGPNDADVRASEYAIASAQAGLQKSRADLAKITSGASAEDIKAAEIGVGQSKASLWAAQVERDGYCGTGIKVQCDAGNAKVSAADMALAAAVNNLAKVKAGPRSEDLVAAQQGVASAQAELESAQAKLVQIKKGTSSDEIVAAQTAITQAEQALALKQKPYIAADVNSAKAEVRRAQAQLDLLTAGSRPEAIAAAEAEVLSAKAALDQARAGLAETELHSPFAGIVASVGVKRGEYVQTGMPIFKIADLSAWSIETTNLTEMNIVRIHQGSPATITFSSIPDLELTGQVAQIKPIGEKKQGDLVYTIVVKPDRQDDRLRWNMTGTVAIETR